jgi:hypothetical protein
VGTWFVANSIELLLKRTSARAAKSDPMLFLSDSDHAWRQTANGALQATGRLLYAAKARTCASAVPR